jgi:hypothetical protein
MNRPKSSLIPTTPICAAKQVAATEPKGNQQNETHPIRQSPPASRESICAATRKATAAPAYTTAPWPSWTQLKVAESAITKD